MPDQVSEKRLYGLFASVGQGLASDRRLQLLELLAQSPRHVEALAEESGLSVASVSQHLQVLRAARLVDAEREGTRSRYRLAGDDVVQLCALLRNVAHAHLEEVRRLSENDDVLTWAEFIDLLAAGVQLVLLDTRPRIEFDHAHMPDASAFPLADAPELMSGLPRRGAIVTYSRHANCPLAGEATTMIRAAGYDAMRLGIGWLEWRARAIAEGPPPTGASS